MNIRPILNFYTSLFAAIGLLFFMFPKALDGQVKLVLSEDFNISANNKLADLSQAGGYNSPQFAIADLNNDGTGELFIYDRNTQRQFALNLGESGVQTLFKPNLKLPISDWFKLVDYNCDNIPDLLTGSTGAIAAYPGIYVDNLLQVNENPRILRSTYQLSTQTFEANIFVNPIDIPIARDMDNDGDIDILAFSSSGSRVEFHENVSTGCDLEFRLQSGCYGYFLEAEENAKIELGIDKCPLQVQSTPFLKHSGTTLFYLDQDRQLILGELEYDSLVQIQMEPDGMANDSAVSVGLFPLNNALAAKEFLAVYDGFNPDEIIVAPNTSGSSDTQEAVQRLKRNSKNNWENLDDNFLHNRMLDLGRNTNTTVFNSEGEIIVLAATQVQRNSQLQNLIYRFRLENKEQLHLVDSCEIVLPNNEIIYSISVSPISNLLYVGTEGGSIYKVDAGLISCNFESDNIQQLQGSSSSASTTFSAISATDINGDGLDDLIIGSRNGGMKLLLGKSSGGLENFSSIWEEINVQHPLAPNVFAKPSVFSYAGRDYLWNFSFDGKAMIYELQSSAPYINPIPVSSFHGDAFIGTQPSISFYNEVVFLGLSSGGLLGMSMDSFNPNINQEITVFPNPSTGLVRINSAAQFEAKLYSLSGKLVAEKDVELGLNGIQFQVEHGSYILKLRGSNGQQSVHKIVIVGNE